MAILRGVGLGPFFFLAARPSDQSGRPGRPGPGRDHHRVQRGHRASAGAELESWKPGQVAKPRGGVSFSGKNPLQSFHLLK